MIIAVDFDGTIVKNEFPGIGEEIPFAIDSLLMLQKKAGTGDSLDLSPWRTFDRGHQVLQKTGPRILCREQKLSGRKRQLGC